MPKGMEMFIKLRDRGMVAARHCTSARRQMRSERMKVLTVPALPFINQFCIWTKKEQELRYMVDTNEEHWCLYCTAGY